MNDKTKNGVIKFTEKGIKLNEAINDGFNLWLEASEMTINDLLKFKDVKGFHIQDGDKGSYMAYYEKGEEKQIGVGLYKEQLKEAKWIFGYVCATLDNGNDYKSDFATEYLKWGAKNE